MDRKRFSEFGAHEFRKCVQYVSEMPHVKDKNLELGSELSSAVFWRAKKVFIEVVWRGMFASHFCKFFKKIMKNDRPFIRTSFNSRWHCDDDVPKEHRLSVFFVRSL